MKNVGSEATLQNAVDRLNAVRREIAKIIVGQDDVVEGVLICLLSGGHVLLEGVPGLGKTLLVRTLSEVLELSFSRAEIGTLFLGVLVGAIVAGDGRSNWYKGAQLTLVYAMIAILFYFLPAGSH